MKINLVIVILISIILGCKNNIKHNDHGDIEEILETSEDSIRIKNKIKEDIEREDYYGFDTLLIKEYISNYGHRIRLEGSKSNDIYRIVVESKQGNKGKFQIAESWYGASHSSILWDNDNYIFVWSGCGTSCWVGQILSLNDHRGILKFPEFLYDDSTRNVIVYPDAVDLEKIIIENFDNQKEISINLNLCDESAIPFMMIDTIYIDKKEILRIRYKKADCLQLIEEAIDIEMLRN